MEAVKRTPNTRYYSSLGALQRAQVDPSASFMVVDFDRYSADRLKVNASFMKQNGLARDEEAAEEKRLHPKNDGGQGEKWHEGRKP